MDFSEKGSQQIGLTSDPFGRSREVMDLGEKGNKITDSIRDAALSRFQGMWANREEEVGRIREEKGLSGDECIYCGQKIEENRLKLKFCDCAQCHREIISGNPSVSAQKVAAY